MSVVLHSDVSEYERFTKLAITGYSQGEQEDIVYYAIVHFLDNMAGKEQGLF